MKVSVAAAEGGGGGRSSWPLFGYEVNESWEGSKEGRKEGRKEGWDPFSTACSLARRHAEVKGGKRSAAAERERSRETKYKSSDHACFKVGRTDGRTDGGRRIRPRKAASALALALGGAGGGGGSGSE